VDEKTCGRGGFSCFFEDFTNCTASEAEAAQAPSLLRVGREGLNPSGGPKAVMFDWESQTAAIKAGILRHFVPPRVRHKGNAWWRGQAVRFLMTPRPWLRGELEASKARMGWQAPAISIHVRHGDKLKEANRLTVQDYLRIAGPMASALGAKSLFVSTDSPDVVQEVERLAPPGVKVCYEADEIRGTDITNANLQNNLRMNVTRYTLEAVRGVFLLAEGEALVGTFSSNFGRLAYELMLSTPPSHSASKTVAFSLDLPWFAYP